MKHPHDMPFVKTVKERCRVCYTCVRECPAKAIRIADGQAEVIGERCIACGNCVRVCSQNAKQVYSSKEGVAALLEGPDRVAAILAPSFPADFQDIPWRRLVGMVRALGFDIVGEVGFGADLVASRIAALLQKSNGTRYVSTACPAIVGYVERYHPSMVSTLAPIVSPMIASARVFHHIAGKDTKVVFIGPCIAKKVEAATSEVLSEVNEVLTFVELREMLQDKGIEADVVEPSDFDEPHANLGALFPISRGMLQAADIREDLVSNEVVATEGHRNFLEALREFEGGHLEAHFLEMLACDGCIMGAGIFGDTPLFKRRASVSRYVQQRQAAFDPTKWQGWIDRLAAVDLSRRFSGNDQRIATPMDDELIEIMKRMGKFEPEDELNCGACGYETCRDHAIAIYKGFAESEMCLPYTIEQLKTAVSDLAVSHEQLAMAQEALLQSEKLASMGQLAAGIAHELNNPLGVVLMYAHILLGECDQREKLRGDLEMIAKEADRCKRIVSGLLHFARQNKIVLQSCDIKSLAQECLKAMPPPQGIDTSVRVEADDTVAEIDRDQVMQVLSNLVTNAYAAMNDGGNLEITIDGNEDEILLEISDTGIGIPRENLAKIFDPFFTTKQLGKGTGLGLAVTYGIVKMHNGDISVRSNADEAEGPTGTAFTVKLPRHEETGGSPSAVGNVDESVRRLIENFGS